MAGNSNVPAKTREVVDYLKRCARDMRTVTYKEIAEQETVQLAKVGVGRPLGYIRDNICRQRGLPWLNAIAVNEQTRRPGEGFLPPDIALSSSDKEHLWRGMVLQVFAYEWERVEFAEPVS